MRIGFEATRIAIAGYVVPFMAVYDPALMLQAGTWLDTVYVTAKAAIAVGLWGAAATGFFLTPFGWPARIFAVAAACFLVLALPITDEIGFALAAAFVVWQLWQRRQPVASPA
jgi:TRAP-type uncharacterized transport system fused permease subunit